MRLVFAAAAAFAVLATGSTGVAAPSPARLQVTASEFHLVLSRTVIRHGQAVVELVNGGQDDHDLALRRIGGTRSVRLRLVHPGATTDLDTRLRPGRYLLWCTLADHRARGMWATLRVR